MAQPRPVKICTLGESGAGKSSLIMRLTTGNFSASQVRERPSVPVLLLVLQLRTGAKSPTHTCRAANYDWCGVRRLELAGRQNATGDLVRFFARMRGGCSRHFPVPRCERPPVMQGYSRTRALRHVSSYVLSVRARGIVDGLLSAPLVRYPACVNCQIRPECRVSCLIRYVCHF